MFNNRIKILSIVAFLLIIAGGLFAQTDHWTVLWDKNPESDMWRYNVYRDTHSQPVQNIGFISHPDTEFVDTQIEKGVLYYYRVTALDSAGNESDYSDEVSVSMPKISGLPASLTLPPDTTYTIQLNNFVIDPDQNTSQLHWTSGTNTLLSVNINATTNVLSIATPPGWNSQENVDLTVTDSLGLFDKATITIKSQNSVNFAPVVSGIPNQTIQEGATFDSIYLDDYVADPNNSDDEIQWSVSGANQLVIVIDSNRVAQVSTPDSNWFGSETVEFKATDPTNLFDVASVTFTVTNVNDAPQFSPIDDQVFAAGVEEIQLNLANYVTDIDNQLSELSWGVSGEQNLQVTISPEGVATVTILVSGWSGSEQLTFRVTDPGGLFAETTVLFYTEGAVVASGVTALNLSYYGSGVNVRLQWQTENPTRDFIEYGLTANYIDSTGIDNNFQTVHERILENLEPNQTYHYRIVSLDTAGLLAYSPDSTFTTGQPGGINVFPIPFVANQNFQTGFISFTNLPVNGKIVIYDLLGEPVFKTTNVNPVYRWNVKNNAGRDVQSGLYLYVIRDGKNKKVKSGKLIIVR